MTELTAALFTPARGQTMRFFDEMHVSSAKVRDHYKTYDRWLGRQPRELMA